MIIIFHGRKCILYPTKYENNLEERHAFRDKTANRRHDNALKIIQSTSMVMKKRRL